ncbi:MAG: GntR family transcriptional regulator [Lachnospiraceae bacterium]|nr:GntR family transcriptional regulator [Lachnospiraceae bacterium]
MFQLDILSSVPIYEQLIRKIKENIMKEYLKPGDHLPSVRKMARDLNVTPNTVQKAYSILEQERVIVTVRGKGAFVADKKPEVDYSQKIAELSRQLKPLVMELLYSGMNRTDILGLVEEFCEEIREGQR